jgi:MtN3 and saliva related transmembrane protein
MTRTYLAVAASLYGVLMGFAPVLQIRRMLRERSSRQVSLGYFVVLLSGFTVWFAYGVAARLPALMISNSVAFVVSAAVVVVAVRLRREERAELAREVSRAETAAAAAGARGPELATEACGPELAVRRRL